MKISNIKLPKKVITTRLNYVKHVKNTSNETTNSQGDPTNTCTTLYTTTHFV